MSLSTYYVQNRDYSLEEVGDKFRCMSINYVIYTAKYSAAPLNLSIPSDVLNNRYSGIEVVNFLNEYKQAYDGPKMHEAVNKFINHKYDKTTSLTLDDTGWFKWPIAVLCAYKEDLPDYKNLLLDADFINESSPLVSEIVVIQTEE